MAFSSRPFLPDKSSNNKSPLNPNKTSSSSHAKFHRQQHHANANPKAPPNECEQKENHAYGSQKGRLGFPHSSPAAAGKSFLSPRGMKTMSSAVRSPLIRFSPKKILGDRNNLQPKEQHVADDETLLKENQFRLCSSTAGSPMITKDIDGAQKKQKEEVAEEELLGFEHAVSPEPVIQNSHLQQHFADASYGKNSLKEMIFSEEVDDLSTVTEDYSLNRRSTQRFGLLCEDSATFVEHSDNHVSDITEGNNLPTQSIKHESEELKHEDDHLHSGCTLDLTESCGSATDALGSTTHLGNELTPSETLEKSETEVSSKSLAAKEEDGGTTGEGEREAVFAGLFEANEKAQLEVFEVKFDHHPQSTAKSRFFYAKVFGLLCFAAVLFLTCRSPELLSSFDVHQSPLPRLWQANSYGEQMKMLLKGTHGLWTDTQLTYSHYPNFQDLKLQKNVKIAVAVMKKHLQSAEISSKLIRTWRFLNKEVIGHLNVESSQKGIEQLWRYIISTISKVNKDLCSGALPSRLAEHVKAQNLLVVIEPMTTQLEKMCKSLKIRLVAMMTQLEEVCMSLRKKLVTIFEAQNFQASVKKWRRASVDFVSSAIKSFHYDSLLSRLHSKYKALTHIIVETVNAKKLVLIEAVTRKPAQANNQDILLPAVEEWDWFSEYDIPSDEYFVSPEDNERAMAGYTDLSQLDELLSAILYGESEEIKARYLDLLHVLESDENLYAVEDVELPSNSLIESKQPVGEGIVRENNQCHTETWEEELLSVCAISNKNTIYRLDLTMDAPICEDFTTTQSTDNGDDKMLIGMENMEVDDNEIKPGEVVENPAANDPHTSQFPGFDLHHEAAGISSADSAGQTFLTKDSNIQSLGSSLNISNGIYVLTILAFTILAYYIYSYYNNLPKAKTHPSLCGHIGKKKGESPKWKEMEVQTQKPKKMETLRSNAPGGFSTPECLKAKNLEEAFITSPDSCVGSPFGSFTSYKRVIVSEGQEQEQVRLTPVRRSSRIRNQTTI